MTFEAKELGPYGRAALVGILTFCAGTLTVRAAGWRAFAQQRALRQRNPAVPKSKPWPSTSGSNCQNAGKR
jgi:UPF0716 family protein affecting phage T7 exclusion